MKRNIIGIATTGFIGYAVGMSCHFPSAQATYSNILIVNDANHTYVSMEQELLQKITDGLDRLEAILAQTALIINYDRLSWATSRILTRITRSSYTYREILKVIYKSPRDQIP